MNLKSQIFTDMLLHWYDQHGRKNLPWQEPRSAYRVWLSEMMLQQTQVKTVIPYFNRFIERFPTIESLAKAHEDEVMALWAGLGYYSRARNLHKTAKLIHAHYQDHFPDDLNDLIKLPGIGPSTAAAIASLAFERPTAILDGNVKRVLCRYFGVAGDPGERTTQKELWALANHCMPKKRCAAYTQAIMDMGALCCTIKKPNCKICPLSKHCIAYSTQRIEDYPQKKIKAKIPDKFQQVLLIHTPDKAIYFEKRPSPGIWGGLWCLPCMDETNDAIKIKPFITIKHTLTHMRMHLAVTTLSHTEISLWLKETPGKWLQKDEIKNIGLPKPMKQIIEYFYSL